MKNGNPQMTISPSGSFRRVGLAMITVFVLLAASCSSDDTEQTATEPAAAEAPTAVATALPADPPATPVPAPTEAPETPAEEPEDEVDVSQLPLAGETIEWRACGAMQCGEVEVPVDYDDPSAGTLSIAVNIHRSPDLDSRVGYLFINPGGPGGSGIGYATQLAQTAPDELIEAFDIVGFDPRGVGDSEPEFSCGDGNEWVAALREIDGLADEPAEIEIGATVAARCVEAMGPVAMQLGTDEVARDMDSIREALGADKISYFGVSYGSTIGPWYASLFPERVHSMVVDGAGNPLLRVNDSLEKVRRTSASTNGPVEQSLERILASCDDADCPIWNDGDPTGYWYEHAPKMVGLADSEYGPPAVILGLIGYQYSQDQWPALLEAVALLGEEGDLSGFDGAIDYSTLGAAPGQSFTIHVNCLDTWALFPDRDAQADVQLLVDNADVLEQEFKENFPLVYAAWGDAPPPIDVCQFFDTLEPPRLEADFDGGDVPIMVVGNRTDPVTAYVQSEQYANEVLADGRLVIVEHFKHGVYGENECVNDFVHAALIEQTFPDETVECSEQAPVSAALADVSLVETTLENGATGLVPDGWDPVAPDVFSRPATGPGEVGLLVYQPSGGTVLAAVADAEDVLGGTAEQQGELEVNGVVWALFDLEVGGGQAARFAVSPGEDGIYILGLSTEDEIDILTEAVLMPALQAYTPA